MAFGKLTEFNISSGNWTSYVERAEMFFKANSIAETMWVPTLIAAMGDEAYELLSNLLSPKKPSEEAYKNLVKVLKEHLQPKPSFMAERYRFRQRRQMPGESVCQYITELKKLSKYCEFAATLEENIRDQLVCGLRSDAIRQRLFAEERLDYAKAVKLSCAMEAAERDAAAVERSATSEGEVGAGTSSALHKISQRGGRGRGRRGIRAQNGGCGDENNGKNCKVCGVTGHGEEVCRYRKFVCGKCKQTGHLRRVCPRRSGQKEGSVAHMQSEDQEEPSEEDEPPVSDNSGSELEEEIHQMCLNGFKPI